MVVASVVAIAFADESTNRLGFPSASTHSTLPRRLLNCLIFLILMIFHGMMPILK